MHPLIERLLIGHQDLQDCAASVEAAFETLRETFAGGGKLLVCGNGGSAADSDHIVGELMKGFMRRRSVPERVRTALLQTRDGQYAADRLQGALPALSLVGQSALCTAVANDVAPDMIFAQQVYGYAKPGDALLAVSTSGNSRNVLLAAQVARALGVRTIGLTGRTGGRMKEFCDVMVCVPQDATPEIQERHLPIYHALCIMLEEEFFSE
ncbi:MAG: D-sedoheptulose-7-phosphate isomerase [Bacilli bacterium]